MTVSPIPSPASMVRAGCASCKTQARRGTMRLQMPGASAVGYVGHLRANTNPQQVLA